MYETLEKEVFVYFEKKKNFQSRLQKTTKIISLKMRRYQRRTEESKCKGQLNSKKGNNSGIIKCLHVDDLVKKIFFFISII